MRTRLKSFGVFSLSAIDLFAAAMGAFIIITIILMPYYQKEVRLEGHLAYLEALTSESAMQLDETREGMRGTREALKAALQLFQELQAEQEITYSELLIVKAQLRASQDFASSPPPSPIETDQELASKLVTFRFLGLRTEKTRFLFLLDMNKYLSGYQGLVMDTLTRALDSLQPGHEFAILGFQQMDSGPRYHRWPESGQLATMNRSNRSRALRFANRLKDDFGGSSSLIAAFEQAFSGPAEAIILLSDGLPNPAFNHNLPPIALISSITLANSASVEIHTVAIGDYFKYKGTVDFMQALARANYGGFLALAQ